MRILKTLRLTGIKGNIGDNINHYDFYKNLKKRNNFNEKKYNFDRSRADIDSVSVRF